MHTVRGWETPRVGRACETVGPHCKIRRIHPRVGHYETGLLGAGCSPGVFTCGLRVSHVPAFNILTFSFTDAITSTTLAYDDMGGDATNPK